MKIILTGATGLIGSRFEELMHENHEIIPLSSAHGVDITDKNSISAFLEGKQADAIIHLAAKTDVDGGELDKEEDLAKLSVAEENILDLDINSVEIEKWKGEKSSFAINVIGTKNLYDVAKEMGIKFVYISTDFVFSGKEESYSEDAEVAPVDWYGMTKYLGETIVNQNSDLIVRISFPYGFLSPVKKDFIWKLHDLLKDRDEVSLIFDQIITPTFIDDVVNGLVFLLEKQVTGIWHLTGSQSLTPKEIGEKIKETFGYDTTINSMDLATLYNGKAPRPFKSIIKNAKIVELGFTPLSFDKGLELLKNT